MAEEPRELQTGDGADLDRRQAIWRALVGGPVIVTLSSRPAWAASQYHYGPPPGCDPPPKPIDPNCNPND